MKRTTKLLVLASLTAVATFALGVVPIAQGHGHVRPTCSWSVDKTASLPSNPSVAITSLDLARGQTIAVDYKVVVTRDCEEGFDPNAANYGADVVDSSAGTLATGLFGTSSNLHESATFTYSRDITAENCESFDVVNTVDVVHPAPAGPTFATDTNTLRVNVQCEAGCTLTQGYWKTHSSYGPASKPDAAWTLLPGGAGPNTTFFLSGKSWYQVFWTPPAGGNAYYSLAHQYMAARLNVLNGALAPSSVTSAIASATTLFQTYTPAQIGALKGSNATRQQFNALAGTLAAYNEGDIGPGHCDE